MDRNCVWVVTGPLPYLHVFTAIVVRGLHFSSMFLQTYRLSPLFAIHAPSNIWQSVQCSSFSWVWLGQESDL